MKKEFILPDLRIIVLLAALTAMILFCGCATILEDYTLSEILYIGTQQEKPPEEYIQDYDELKSAILDVVLQHKLSGTIAIHNYDGDIDQDIDRASYEIRRTNTIGSYAVDQITGISTRILTTLEVEIRVDYRHTRQHMESIVTVQSASQLQNEVLSAMSEYRDELVFRTSLRNITADSVIKLVRETYYHNPLSIAMMPRAAVETFPEIGDDRIIALSFGHFPPANIQRENTASIVRSVQLNTEAAIDESKPETLLSFAETLIAASVFDMEQAKTISEHGTQNLAATAFGALVIGNAVGEGFAMAFKALSDEAGIYCRVVLGYRDGMIHAWNIVMLNGDFYHIDVSMGAQYGLETAFLKTDADFLDMYSWDTENTVSCHGTLTFEDVIGARTPADTQDGAFEETEETH